MSEFHHSSYFHDRIHKNQAGVTKKKLRIKSGMLRREWRWEDEKDLDTLDGTGDEDLVEVEVTVKLPDTIRQLVLDKEKFGDVRRNVFASFIDWMYLGFKGFGLDQHSARQTDASTLIQLWVFAGKIGVPACQNDCIEGIEMWRQNSGTIQTSELGWIYENTKDYKEGEGEGECRLTKLIIDQCAWLLDGNWMASEEMTSEQSFPRLALLDLVGKMRLLLNTGANLTRDQPPFAGLEWRKKLYWMPLIEREELSQL